MAIKKIKLFSIPVSNQDVAKDFYIDKLGLEIKTDRLMDKEMRWIEVGPKNTETSITLVTWFPSMISGQTKGVVLESSNIDEDYTTLKEKGVKFEDAIQKMPWGRFVNFNDPDGNGLILQESV
jgi:predicted enzyme related to lactoylglutathione lyase